MPLSRSVPLVLACVLASMAMPASARGQNLCTERHMETLPAAVEAPCTERLKNSKLSKKQRADALYVRGRGRHRTGQIRLAAQDYDEAIALQPNTSAFYVNRANTRLRNRDPAAALADLEKSLRLDGRNTRALVIIGKLLLDAGQSEEGLKFIEQALSIDPKQPFGLLFRQEAYAALGRWPEALKDANALVALPPEQINRAAYVDGGGILRDFHIVAMAARAKLYESRGQLAEAEADLSAAIAYRPIAQAYTARAFFLTRQERRETDALGDWQILAAAEPDSSWVQSNRGLLLVRLKRWTDAVEALDRAIEIDREGSTAYELRGLALKKLGRFDEAFSDLTVALERDPSLIEEHLTPLQMAGYYRSGEPPEAMTPLLRDALKACSLDPDCRTQ